MNKEIALRAFDKQIAKLAETESKKLFYGLRRYSDSMDQRKVTIFYTLEGDLENVAESLSTTCSAVSFHENADMPWFDEYQQETK